MTELTSKELLKEISKKQKEEAAVFFEFSQSVSNALNRQEGINTKFSQYLESNNATNQEGAIEKLDRVEKQLDTLEHKIDKKIAYFTGAGVVFFGLAKWLIAKIFI